MNKIFILTTFLLSMSFFACSNSTNADDVDENISSSSLNNTNSSEVANSSNSGISSGVKLSPSGVSYPIVSTNITKFYDDKKEMATIPQEGDAFYGQDANYQINLPSYTDNGDGTITDNVTGLMWQQHMGGKISFAEAAPKAASLDLGGYDDWRVPTLKELYSLILMTGQNNNSDQTDSAGWTRYIDTDYFEQPFGVPDDGDRIIDAQTWADQQYVGLTMNGDTTVFGVNFVDGRIKGYPKYNPSTKDANTMYFRMVRGNINYGLNDFKDNGDETISDVATGLTWQKSDDGIAKDWQEALTYCEDLNLADNSDWRLPSSKELQSIVDYTRSPQTTQSAAINPLFNTTEIVDPDGNPGQYPYFWTRTSHDEINSIGGVYIAFGEAQGKMNGTLMDVHGAGAQRSDPKSGDINDYPQFFGPQGDVLYVYNYVRCVSN